MSQQTQIGWAVQVLDGSLMFFPMNARDEACTYCEHAANPVAVWVDNGELQQHDDAQGDT